MKNKHYLIFSISIVLIIQSFVSVSSTLANQAIVNSSYSFDNFTESNCRGCHSSGVVDRHHILVQSGTYGCINCHPVVTDTTTIIRDCTQCHGTTFNNMTIPLPHQKCISCHVDNIYNISNISVINRTAFSQGIHVNINTSDGFSLVNNSDCWTCHFNRDMNISNNNINRCENCHISGNYTAPIIVNHRPPKLSVSPVSGITTGEYCSVCHNNSINMYAYSANASVSHSGTNTSLIKPTVNQTSIPRFGFMNQSDASAYNKECNNCHNGPYTNNSSWGNPPRITVSHTATGTCNGCHINVSAADLHNGSLGIPQTFGCFVCHTAYASKYKAPNISGTAMAGYGTSSCEGCHGGGGNNGLLDSRTKHNIDRYQRGYTPAGPGLTDNVSLNGQPTLDVTKSLSEKSILACVKVTIDL